MVHIAVFQFPIFREVEKTRCFSFTQETWNFWKYRGKDLLIFQNIRVPEDTILSAEKRNIAECGLYAVVVSNLVNAGDVFERTAKKNPWKPQEVGFLPQKQQLSFSWGVTNKE